MRPGVSYASNQNIKRRHTANTPSANPIKSPLIPYPLSHHLNSTPQPPPYSHPPQT